MLKTFAKFLGGSNESVIKKLRSEIDEINALEPEIKQLSDEQLRAKTDEFRNRYQQDEPLDEIMYEAFAVVREAARRTLGQRHYDVQLMGGIVLHQGKIAEMRTGEGKTLVATLPAYLNSIAGKGVHVVTVNDYLARRDAQWMGQVYGFLGVSVGLLQHERSKDHDNPAYVYDPSVEESKDGFTSLREVEHRKEAYQADITYGTNNEFGFDYLRDNLAVDPRRRVQRELSYAIVDEVDNILIDEARTPLIISGAAEKPADLYIKFSRLVRRFEFETDYTVDEKHRSVSLTQEGISRLEQELKIGNIYDSFEYVHFAENALKAHAIFEKDRNYVVQDNQVIIVDEFTGRLMHGRRYSDGLHQALEAKESVAIQRESVTHASISLQNYFRIYEKLAGMTGTAVTEAEEFHKIYELDVVEIPTNRDMNRQDLSDLVYKDEDTKFKAVVKEVERLNKIGAPVLIGTTDVDRSEKLSKMLNAAKIPHSVLNAKQHQPEAEIIAQAGRPKAVTVATNMAGRGTDIILGGNPDGIAIDAEDWEADHKKVVELGGLHVIGTERHDSRRVDNQLRGRAGRQGDPGATRFYVGLDDELMRRFGGERFKTVMTWAGLDEDTPIENKMISKSIENAQVKVEAYHFDQRKHLVEYDAVVNTQRDNIYGERNKIVDGADPRSIILPIINKEVYELIEQYRGEKGDEVPANELEWADFWLTELGETDSRNNQLGRTLALSARLNSLLPPTNRTSIEAVEEWLKGLQYYDENRLRELAAELRFEDTDSESSVKGARSANDYKKAGRRSRMEIDHVKTLRDVLVRSLALLQEMEDSGDASSSSDESSTPLIVLRTVASFDIKEIAQRLEKLFEDKYDLLEERAGKDEVFMFGRRTLRQVVDRNWIPHLTEMENLRQGIGLEAYGQRDPLVMYKTKGYELFQELQARIQREISYSFFPKAFAENGSVNVADLRRVGRVESELAFDVRKKIGRNQPCYCGSGKKYKKCAAEGHKSAKVATAR